MTRLQAIEPANQQPHFDMMDQAMNALARAPSAEAPAHAAACIDRNTLQALKASMGASFTQLATFFTEDLQEWQGQIETAHQAGRFAELRRIAHTLKSSSQLFGCHALSSLAKDVEDASQRNDVSPAAIRSLMASISQHAAELKALQSTLR